MWFTFRVRGASERSFRILPPLGLTLLAVGSVVVRLGDGIVVVLDMIPSSTLGGFVGEKGNVRRDVGDGDAGDTIELVSPGRAGSGLFEPVNSTV